MHKLLAGLISAAFLVVSVPAFACDGHKEAKAEGSDTVVTSGHDAACTNPEGKCDHKDHDKKKAKKAKASTGSTDGDA